MAIYNLIGGTASKLNIILYGGYGDIITLTNVRNGKKYENINLESSMKKEIEVVSGTYIISSNYLTEAGISLPQIEFGKKNNVAYCYPAGTIFWYGNGDTSGDTLWSKFGTGFVADSWLRPDGDSIGKSADFTFTSKDNSYEIYYGWQGTGDGYRVCANAYLDKTLDTTDYSKIHIAGSMTGIATWHSTDNLVHHFTPKDSVRGIPAELDAGSRLVVNQTGYVDPYGTMKNTITINAIWLE